MTKNNDDDKDWGLNLKEDNKINISSIFALEFRNIMAQALHTDDFATQILKNELPEKWHLEDDALWYELNQLYIPESLRIKAKELSHDNQLAGH